MTNQENATQTNPPLTLAERRAFTKLSIDKRRRILAEQADQMVEHYQIEAEQTERQHWQGGDIVES